MSDLVDIGSGIICDGDTGEILEIPDGGDPLAMVAYQLMTAMEQIKAWERAAAVAKQVLIKGQEAKRAVYGDVVVRVQSAARQHVDASTFAELLDEHEVPRELLLSILRNSTIKPDFVPADFHPKCVSTSFTKPFVVIDRVRKLAPEVRGER